MALGQAAREAHWVNGLAMSLGFGSRTVTIYEDNQPCISLAKNPTAHGRTKHIDVVHHSLQDDVDKGRLKIEYLNTELMPADLLTKPLSGKRTPKLGRLMGLDFGQDVSDEDPEGKC